MFKVHGEEKQTKDIKIQAPNVGKKKTKPKTVARL